MSKGLQVLLRFVTSQKVKFYKFSNNLLIQFGQVIGYQDGTKISFSISFSEMNYQVVTQRNHRNLGTLYYHSIQRVDLTQFVWHTGGSGGADCLLHFIAIGY